MSKLVCPICRTRLWTYQGLARHMMTHPDYRREVEG